MNYKNCGVDLEFHVDELFAKQSKVVRITAGLTFLMGTPLVFFLINSIFQEIRSHYVIYVIGGFLSVSLIAYAIMNKQDQTRKST